METPTISPPTKATLRKYGLSEEDWRRILDEQGGVCPICEKVPSTGRFVIDHFHARGFKKMSPEEKRACVRGLTCWFDNHSFLGRGITVAKARNVVAYLERFEARRPI